MHIGYLAPMSWNALRPFLPQHVELPEALYFEAGSQVVAELVRRGHHVSVFTLSPSVRKPIRIEGKGLTLHIGAFRGRGKIFDVLRQERHHLKTMLRSDPCDVYHANWIYEYACASLSISRSRTLVTAHDKPTDVLRYASWREKPYRFLRLLMGIWVLLRTRHLSVLTPFDEKYFRRVFHYARPIWTTPNGVLSCSSNMVKQNSNSFDFAFLANQFFGLKNGEMLLKAWRLVLSKGPSARLFLIGKGLGEDGKVAQYVKQQGFENVVFVGFIEKKEDLLRFLCQNVRVLVHPSLTEGMSLSILEAMSLGIPVVGGERSGGVPWLLENGKAGLLVDVSSPKSLADGMLDLMIDETLYHRLSSAAKSRSMKFSVSAVTSELMAIYERIYVGTEEKK